MGAPYPGPQLAAFGFLPPGLGDLGHQAQLGWAPLSSLTLSQKLWMGLSWDLKNAERFTQGYSSYSRIHHYPPARRVLPLTHKAPQPGTSSLASKFSPSFHSDYLPPLLAPQITHHRQDRQSYGPGPGPHSCPHRFELCEGRRRSSHLWYSQPCHCYHRCHPVHSQEGESPAQSAGAVHQFAASPSEAALPPGWEEGKRRNKISGSFFMLLYPEGLYMAKLSGMQGEGRH